MPLRIQPDPLITRTLKVLLPPQFLLDIVLLQDPVQPPERQPDVRVRHRERTTRGSRVRRHGRHGRRSGPQLLVAHGLR